LAKGNDTSSEIAFGGHNQDRAASQFSWAAVASAEQGYWQVALAGVYVGDQPLSVCANSSCRAVLDSGTSLLGIPQEAISHLHRLLARPVEGTDKDCQAVPGPPIVFDFGSFQLRLGADDYSRPAPMTVKSRSSNSTFAVCRASLLPVPANVDMQGSSVFIFLVS
jgi:cathepsin D